MSFDSLEERAGIKARLKTLAGGRVYTNGATDDEQIKGDGFGGIKPYIMIYWGSLYPSSQDRTITGERDQPQVFPVTIECWSSNSDISEKLSASVRNLMLDWEPSPTNSTALTFAGGGSFTIKNSEGKPTRFNETVMMETVINQSPPIGDA